MKQEKTLPLMDLARKYTQTLARAFGERLVSVVVYGSVARGETTPTSDIDMLIVARDLPLSRRARNQILVELEDELAPMLTALYRQGIVTEISSKIKTPEEARQFTPLYLDLTEDAVILYDRDGFFQGVLDRLRQKLDALGARRMRQGQIQYWQLKPDYRWGEVFEL